MEDTDLKEQIVVLERTFNPYDRTGNKNNDDILNNIFMNGFYIADEKYIFFTSSSSQTKQMKLVFIKETIFEKYKTLFFNGLNLDDINTNLSKWLAYVSLCETSTREWKDFNIDKCIVVDDFEKNVTGTVDYIDDKKYSIKRENEKTIKMNINDGCGLILPTLSEKIITIRLPFFKGLLAPYPFYEHCKEAEKLRPFKDIDGEEWTYDKLIEKDIQIIFTKSQFKTWKLYGNKPFESYKEQYKKHEKQFKICLAGICLEEENEDEFKDKRINYQMLQTLIDMNQSDLEKLLNKTFEEIKGIVASQDKTIKKIACGNESVSKLLTKFPMLLGDDDVFDICRKKIKNIENRAKQGKFVISSKRVFILPDLYSFCNHLFCSTDTGLLEDGEISCNLFENEKVIDCLRSPQLYLEHAIRKNVINEKTKKWFCSNGLYTSTKDLISLVILNDYDGDEILAVDDSDYVELAKKHVEKYDVVPLYYKFGKAEEVDYSKDNMLNAIRVA